MTVRRLVVWGDGVRAGVMHGATDEIGLTAVGDTSVTDGINSSPVCLKRDW